eukprot:COSAG01_NODE_12492_length_1729_cov_4.769325_1_plen_166_part_00
MRRHDGGGVAALALGFVWFVLLLSVLGYGPTPTAARDSPVDRLLGKLKSSGRGGGGGGRGVRQPPAGSPRAGGTSLPHGAQPPPLIPVAVPTRPSAEATAPLQHAEAARPGSLPPAPPADHRHHTVGASSALIPPATLIGMIEKPPPAVVRHPRAVGVIFFETSS